MASRPSDDESAPLLQDTDDPHLETGSEAPEHPSFSQRVGSLLSEPLTTLNRVLLVLLLFFLLLSSIFIGLFAGAQYKLRHRNDEPGKTPPSATFTSVVTAPTTVTQTTTSVFTTTAVPAPVPTTPPQENVCLTPQCVRLSAAILSSLDTSQDPCENFYDYATGGWRKSYPLPSDKGRYGTFNALFQENQQIVRDILESNSSVTALQGSTDDLILRKLRSLYSSCMNEDTLDKLGEQPLQEVVAVVKKLYRGESTDITKSSAKFQNNRKENKKDGLTAALAYLHSRELPGLFDFTVEGDAAVDPNFMVLWFSQPDLGLPSKEYFEDKPTRKVYKDVIRRLLTVAYADEEESQKKLANNLVQNEEAAKVWPPWPWPPWGGDDDDDKSPKNHTEQIKKLAKKVVKFERRIAQASLDLDVLQQDPIGTYNKVPISNITTTLPQINFDKYLSTFNPRNFPSEVIVTYPAYVSSLFEILDTTEREVIEAYLVTRVALGLASRLSLQTESWKARRHLDEVLTGIKPGAVGDRAEYCVNAVDQALGYATGRYFVNETFGGDSKEKGTKVITDIVKSFKASLPHISWMDDKSANAAAHKADVIRVKVGYPLSPDTTSAESIARYYSLVKVSDYTYFDNMLSASASEVYLAWQHLGKQRDMNAWEMTPATVNAYYNPPANEIVFPAGILRPPFFSKEWPSYLKYGAFGQVAAHELTHAFDSAGRLYNQEGKLEEWWTNTTSKGFLVKQKCIVDQYSSYSVTGPDGKEVHVNGNLTSGENIGDSGIIQAYRAWQAQYDDSYKAGDEYLLPGLNFTREQLFFLAFGRIWSENIKPASLVQRVRSDPHSPNQFRVDGTLYNVPEFAKAFNCSSKAKLNPPPEKQCKFW
ncbi:hypothetical protein EVG20_g5570 [Dentipellis fragilis]|uniref:Peptidase M13 N-terminal domain-containing protein n=1 Tax=Dentipellis fragilis TaxID=205917 RepID=A0A4Y9YSU5_9AGAM|nr:hypothetical protein EVG20_g5570 [Dentipellis fragilis]